MQDLYNFGSDVLHGRKARGLEFCPPSDQTFVRANLFRAMLVLNHLTGIDAVLDRQAKAGAVLMAINALRQAFEIPETDWQKTIRIALRPESRLKRGRDYTGDGTENSPYVFSAGLPYHETFYVLCEQLQLDAEKRRLHFSSVGLATDVVPSDGRDHYFLIPREQILTD